MACSYDPTGVEFDAAEIEFAQVISSMSKEQDLALLKITKMPAHVSGSKLISIKVKYQR